MDTIILRNGYQLPLIGLGTFPLHGEVLRNSIEMAFDIGYQMLDTAHLYRNEEEIGNILNILNNKNCYLSSKCCSAQFNGRKRYLYLNKRNIYKNYTLSCKKLGVEKLSIYLLHSCFPNYEKAYSEMITLYKNGKVPAIGVCNAEIDNLVKINDTCGEYPMINQIELHPFHNRRELVNFCKKNNIAIMAHSPFAHGDAMSELLSNEVLKLIAKNHNKTVAQVILRWITQQGIAVIPRSTNRNRLKENYDIFDFILSDDEIKQIDSLNREQSYGVRSANQKE